MKREKYIVLATVILASLLSSCARIEKIEEQDNREAIAFSWYANRASYKANPDFFVGDASASNSERHLNSGTSFGVFGYFHSQTSGVAGGWQDSKDNYPNLFYNEAVSIAENSGTYTYDYVDSRYWPKNTLDRISFIAYYPWNELNTSGSATANTVVEPFLDSSNERDGMVGFYYVVPEDSEDQVDFMVSDLCADQSKALWNESPNTGLTGTADGKVKFFFHHALSQVRVKSVNFNTGGNDDIELKISYIMFNNVAVFGQCIPVPDFSTTTATGRTTVNLNWPVDKLVSRRPNLTSGVKADVCYNESTGTWDVKEFLLMIPHTFFTGATIEVNFDVNRKKDAVTGEYYSYKDNTLSAPLTTTNIYGWEPGKIYTYNITLDLEQVKAEAEVIDWLEAGDDVILDN